MESLYVCLFSNGHIKVGRSYDVTTRIAAHTDRVACMGVELVDSFTTSCDGSAVACEQSLIARCAAAASKRFQNEWFTGLSFDAVCGWASEAAAQPQPAPAEESALRVYMTRLRGRQQEFADKVGTNVMYLRQIAAGWRGRQPSAELCVRIERATGGEVTRRDLRADWQDIWPELAKV